MARLFHFLVLFPLIAALFSCEKQKIILTDRTVIHQDQNDQELLRITNNARDSLSEFFRHMLRPAKDERNFMVKYPLKTDANSGFYMEHIWLCDIQYKNGVYYGTAANTPFYISSIKKGDVIPFSMEEISDWMYIKGEKIAGGYSIKYLLEQLADRSEEQQHILEMFHDMPE